MNHFFRKLTAGVMAGLMLAGSSAAMAEGAANDVPLRKLETAVTDAAYYKDAIETEVYNYKLVRNLPTTFTQESWETYCSLANGMAKLDAANLADVQKKMVDDTIAAREALVQAQPLNDSIWYIWGDDIATIETDTSALEFTVSSYDNAESL